MPVVTTNYRTTALKEKKAVAVYQSQNAVLGTIFISNVYLRHFDVLPESVNIVAVFRPTARRKNIQAHQTMIDRILAR